MNMNDFYKPVQERLVDQAYPSLRAAKPTLFAIRETGSKSYACLRLFNSLDSLSCAA